MWLLNSLVGTEEQIRGNPKIVRQEHQGSDNMARLEKVTNYDESGRRIDESVYREDGSLSYRFVFDYGSQGDLTTKTLDSSGSIVGVKKTRVIAPNIEQTLNFDKNGNLLDTCITKMDGVGRILESELSGHFVHATLHGSYGPGESAQLDVAIELGGVPTSRIEIRKNVEGTTKTLFHPTAAPTTDDTEGVAGGTSRNEPSLAPVDVTPNQTSERIDSRDAHGNWTKKTIVEIDAATGAEVISKGVSRSITYY